MPEKGLEKILWAEAEGEAVEDGKQQRAEHSQRLKHKFVQLRTQQHQLWSQAAPARTLAQAPGAAAREQCAERDAAKEALLARTRCRFGRANFCS